MLLQLRRKCLSEKNIHKQLCMHFKHLKKKKKKKLSNFKSLFV